MGFRFMLAGLLAAVMLAPLTFVAAAPAAPLSVGSDVSGAPFEYFHGSSKTPLGFDIDLLDAIAAKMGRQPSITNHQFDDLLKAVQRGEYESAMSAISDTSAREKLVDFLDYFVAGGGLMVQQGNPLHVFGIDGLCGYAVTVESGTSYQADLEKESAKCKALGLPAITILTFKTGDDAFAAFMAGKAPVYVADYPVGVWRARTTGKGLEVVGRQFDVVPYGIAVSKRNTALLTSFSTRWLPSSPTARTIACSRNGDSLRARCASHRSTRASSSKRNSQRKFFSKKSTLRRHAFSACSG